ncbi:hypothetical protein GJ744_010269 [Endocarpon pusillum]|uniref:Uncharacterized protein n=1 Tax=Endocarpon pusillum TaxID=364733 RepID=A0A8H7AGD6_9EURO|nr:hypothetical protein GJ744_010269 [Endocarpon pusillum]
MKHTFPARNRPISSTLSNGSNVKGPLFLAVFQRHKRRRLCSAQLGRIWEDKAQSKLEQFQSLSELRGSR